MHPEAIEWVGDRAARAPVAPDVGEGIVAPDVGEIGVGKLTEGFLVVLVTGVTHRDRV
jgi:hypothetical protein